jgi:hypothetical protein
MWETLRSTNAEGAWISEANALGPGLGKCHMTHLVRPGGPSPPAYSQSPSMFPDLNYSRSLRTACYTGLRQRQSWCSLLVFSKPQMRFAVDLLAACRRHL